MAVTQMSLYEPGYSTKGVAAFAIVFTIIALLSVVFRIWSRALLARGSSRRIGLDDWLAMASVPAILGSTIMIFQAIGYGLGQHIYTLTLMDLIPLIKRIYILQILFALAVGFPKLSALALYARVFGPVNQRRMRWRVAFWTSVVINVAWLFASVLLNAFPCNPPSTYYDPRVPGTCLDGDMISIINSVVDAAVQLPVLLLPVQPLIELNISRKNKLRMIILFLAGYVCPLLAIGRLVNTITLRSSFAMADFSYTLVPLSYFWIAEYGLTVLTVCIPAIFHLIERTRQQGSKSLFSRENQRPENARSHLNNGVNSAGIFKKLRNRWSRWQVLHTAGHDEKILAAVIDSEKVPAERSAQEEKIVASADEAERSLEGDRQWVPAARQRGMTFEEALRMERA